MAADVSFVRGLLLDTFQLQVNCLNVNQFLLCSLAQTVGLRRAREIMLQFCCNSKLGHLLLSPEPLHLSVAFVSWFSAVLAPPVRLFSSLALHHWLPSYASLKYAEYF